MTGWVLDRDIVHISMVHHSEASLLGFRVCFGMTENVFPFSTVWMHKIVWKIFSYISHFPEIGGK